MEKQRQKRPLLSKLGAPTGWYQDPLGFAPPVPAFTPPTYRNPRRESKRFDNQNFANKGVGAPTASDDSRSCCCWIAVLAILSGAGGYGAYLMNRTDPSPPPPPML